MAVVGEAHKVGIAGLAVGESVHTEAPAAAIGAKRTSWATRVSARMLGAAGADAVDADAAQAVRGVAALSAQWLLRIAVAVPTKVRGDVLT